MKKMSVFQFQKLHDLNTVSELCMRPMRSAKICCKLTRLSLCSVRSMKSTL